jgi:type III secretion protein V
VAAAKRAKQGMAGTLSKLASADAALAALVVLIVGLMIVPLPTWLLDILLATNISLSVAVLLVVLYVPDALGIATFPTLLLITTLLRLSLNVSSTRLILLQANAGEVIKAFGNFVVRGNYVVGAVIFAILTIIQFIVIAKGSERVAEVGARFVLDAMPGKQMALDAELRSGAIDANEARKRRRHLARESQFYGAMDGAMKFVKGDVIAGLVITVINIVGGLVIGVLQRGLPVELALKRYGLLTIGDGLVTQIPALLLSTAAGILVTRVASEEPDTSLGSELASQLLSTPKALRNTALFVFVLAIVPGLPALPFAVIGLVLLAVYFSRTRALRRSEAQKLLPDPRSPARAGRVPAFVPLVVPWSLEVSEELAGELDDVRKGDEVVRPGIRSLTQEVRTQLFEQLGVALPPAVVRVSERVEPGSVLLSVFEIPEQTVRLGPASGERLDPLRQAAMASLASRASEFLGMGETQALLDGLDSVAPALVRQVVPKPIGLALLADILRRLVEEQVSIRDLRSILEVLAAASPGDKDPLALTELVRAQLRRATTHRLSRGAGSLAVYLLDSEIEEIVRGAVQRTPSGSFLALAPGPARDIVASVRKLVATAPAPHGAPRVLLTQPDIRRFVRKLIDSDPSLRDVHVVSFQDLMPEIALQPLGRAKLGNN